MARKYIYRKRQNTILYTEFLGAAVIAALVAIGYFKIHPAIALLVAIAALFLFIYLFFAFRIFRYSFSILFSLAWACGAFLVGQKFEKASNTTAWVFAFLAFCLCLWAHWDHFDFLKSAKVYEYERR
jgi:O-antigen/teichoic acid export membrane protein